jgi:hypothetical protein
MILSIYKKIIILILLLVLISLSIYTLIKKEPVIEEESLKEGLAGLPDLKGPFRAISQQFKFFEVLGTIPNRITRFLRSFTEVTEGIGLFFENLGWEIEIAATDTGMFITEFIVPRIQCATDKFAVFNDCAMFYFYDIILHSLYLIFLYYPLVIIELISGVNFTEQINDLYAYLIAIDMYIFKHAGTHVFKYSDETYKKCYHCPNIKNKPSMEEEIEVFEYDFNRKLPFLWNEPMKKFEDAQNDFMSMFE